MGRNPADIETYLKEFDKTKIIAANEKALITGQDEFRLEWEELKRNKRKNLKEQNINITTKQESEEEYDSLESLKRLKKIIEQEILKKEQTEFSET